MGAALVGAGGVIVGTILSAVLGIWAEGRHSKDQVERDRHQRQHELDLRQLELREEHRARLHAERRAAYAGFYRCYWDYDSATDELVKVLGSDPSSATVPGADAVNRFTSAIDALDHAVLGVVLVASTSVEDAAQELRFLVANRRRSVRDVSDEDRSEIEAEHAQVSDAETALRLAIQLELELDR